MAKVSIDKELPSKPIFYHWGEPSIKYLETGQILDTILSNTRRQIIIHNRPYNLDQGEKT